MVLAPSPMRRVSRLSSTSSVAVVARSVRVRVCAPTDYQLPKIVADIVTVIDGTGRQAA